MNWVPQGTAEFCLSKGIAVTAVDWPFEEGEGDAERWERERRERREKERE